MQIVFIRTSIVSNTCSLNHFSIAGEALRVATPQHGRRYATIHYSFF